MRPPVFNYQHYIDKCALCEKQQQANDKLRIECSRLNEALENMYEDLVFRSKQLEELQRKIAELTNAMEDKPNVHLS